MTGFKDYVEGRLNRTDVVGMIMRNATEAVATPQSEQPSWRCDRCGRKMPAPLTIHNASLCESCFDHLLKMDQKDHGGPFYWYFEVMARFRAEAKMDGDGSVI